MNHKFAERIKSSLSVKALAVPPMTDKLWDRLVYLNEGRTKWCVQDDDQPNKADDPGYWDLKTAASLSIRIHGSFILFDPAMDAYAVVAFK